MRPILTRSEITDAVYIVPKYKILEGGVVDAIEKCDVTDQFDAMTEPLRAENDKLRELARRLLTEYRYMRVRPRRVYLGHEKRMRAIEDEMRELGIEVPHECE